MSNRRPVADAPQLDAAGRLDSLISVADDFAALAAAFDNQLSLVPAFDETTRSHMLKARMAAERGLELSRLLLERVRSAESAGTTS